MSYPDLLLESLIFWDEDEFEYKIFSILRGAHSWTSVILAGKSSTTSFSENVVVGGNKLSNVTSFIILLSGEGLTSFSIYNRTNFFGEQKK